MIGVSLRLHHPRICAPRLDGSPLGKKQAGSLLQAIGMVVNFRLPANNSEPESK